MVRYMFLGHLWICKVNLHIYLYCSMQVFRWTYQRAVTLAVNWVCLVEALLQHLRLSSRAMMSQPIREHLPGKCSALLFVYVFNRITKKGNFLC